MRRNSARHELAKDLILIILGAVIAVILARIGTIDRSVAILGGHAVASFVAGIFFTSAFTIAPATVAIAHLAGSAPPATIIIWGALGAMCGDIILFLFIKDRFADDLKRAMKPSFLKHVAGSFHFGFLKWLSPFLGALIIASPLPDEFGLTLMGLSKVRIIILMPIAFVMNMIGIYLIVWLAHVI